MTTAPGNLSAGQARAALNRPLPPWLRGRRTQRALVAAWFAAWMGVVALRLVTDSGADLLPYILAMVAQVLLWRAGRIVWGAYAPALDERQRDVAHGAYARSYPFAVVAPFALWVMIEPLGLRLDAQVLADVLMPVFFLLAGLPAAVVVWTDPEISEA